MASGIMTEARARVFKFIDRQQPDEPHAKLLELSASDTDYCEEQPRARKDILVIPGELLDPSTELCASYTRLADNFSTFCGKGPGIWNTLFSSIHSDLREIHASSPPLRSEVVKAMVVRRFTNHGRLLVLKPPTKQISNEIPIQRTDNAMCKVIETPELIEAILSFLPVLDLVIASGVDKMFRSAIFDSPTLQRHLFLRAPNGPPETICVVASDEDKARENPAYEPGWQSEDYAVATLCPFLRLPDESSLYLENTAEERGRMTMKGDIETVEFGLRSNILHSRWTNMFLTSPPCTKVDIEFKYSGRTWLSNGGQLHHTLSAVRTVTREAGVTIASLMDATYVAGEVSIITRVVPGDDAYDWRRPHRNESRGSPGRLRILEHATVYETARRYGGGMSPCYDKVIKLHGIVFGDVAADDFVGTKQEREWARGGASPTPEVDEAQVHGIAVETVSNGVEANDDTG